MNHRRAYRNPNAVVPQLVHDISVNARRFRKGMQVSVRYRFDYAERTQQGVLLIYASGAVSRSSKEQQLADAVSAVRADQGVLAAER
jgi:hypothetical protein